MKDSGSSGLRMGLELSDVATSTVSVPTVRFQVLNLRSEITTVRLKEFGSALSYC